MIFSNSPVKSIVEKINPNSQKNKVSRLKFERKSDYRTFLKFIKDNTQQVEDIKLSETKKKAAIIGGGLLGLGLLGTLFGGDDSDSEFGDKKITQLSSLDEVLRKVRADSKRINVRTKSNLDTATDIFKKDIAFRRKPRDITKKFNKESDRFISTKKGTKTLDGKGRTIKKKLKTNVAQDINVRRNRNKVTMSEESFRISTRPKKGEILREQKLVQRFNKKIAAEANVGGTTDNVGGSGKVGSTTVSGDDGGKITGDSSFFRDDKTQKLRNELAKITKRLRRTKNPSTIERMIKRQNQILTQLGDMDQIGDKEAKFLRDTLNRKNQQNLTKSFNQQQRLMQEYMIDDPNTFPTNVQSKDANINIGKSKNKKFNYSKLFLAPEVPKSKTSKLSNLDKFSRFSNRVLNSPVGKFTTFAGGLLSNPKLEIIKQLFTATPLADGTLEGKPGVGINPENFIFNEDAAVNIFDFSEGRESMIPFSTDVELPSVTVPKDLQSPSNNIIVDYEFTSSDDLFFIKMAGN